MSSSVNNLEMINRANVASRVPQTTSASQKNTTSGDYEPPKETGTGEKGWNVLQKGDLKGAMLSVGVLVATLLFYLFIAKGVLHVDIESSQTYTTQAPTIGILALGTFGGLFGLGAAIFGGKKAFNSAWKVMCAWGSIFLCGAVDYYAFTALHILMKQGNWVTGPWCFAVGAGGIATSYIWGLVFHGR